MEKIKLGAWYTEDINDNAKKIILVSEQIEATTCVLRRTENISSNNFNELYVNITEVLSNWTGNTYIGYDKEPVLKKAFQQFFQSLYAFILACSISKNHKLRKFANIAIYQGPLYRYLGNGDYENRNNKVSPEYNDIWVSWSKNKENSNIASKLYGIITRLTCHTSQSLYGIDLAAFKCSKTNEEEVLYPTIASQVKNIEYFQ